MASNKTKLITPVFRVAFPELTDPTAREPGPDGQVRKKYSVTAIWRPDDFAESEQEQWKVLLAALNEVAQEKLGRTLAELKAMNNEGASYRLVPRNGALKEQNGFGEGTLFATLSANYRPQVIDRQRQPIEDIVGQVYSGCYCRASVRVYAFDNAGKGVAIGLNNLQKVGDGERLDVAGDISGEFDAPLDFKAPAMVGAGSVTPEATKAAFQELADMAKGKGDDHVPF